MNENREPMPPRGRGRSGGWSPRDGENWRNRTEEQNRTEELHRPDLTAGLQPSVPQRAHSNGGEYRALRRPYNDGQRRPYSAPEGGSYEEERRRPHPHDLRRPYAHQPPSPSDSVSDQGGAGDSIPKSTLSVNAPEFYPSGYQMSCPHPIDLENGGGDATMEAVALQHITGVMRHLTRNPDMFDKTVGPLVEAFESWLSDDVTIEVVMTALVEQSIEQPNFQYSGSKLCAMLDRQYPIVFRRSLLNKCREEYGSIMETFHLNPRRLQGFLIFMAELYKQIDLVEGSGKRIVALGNIILECMKTVVLLPTLENVKCVCQTLKLVGQHLDNQDRHAMNEIHQRLRELTANPTVSANIQLLTSAACALRESNWGRDNEQQMPTPVLPPQQVWNDGPVFFGPDGKMLTHEESQFLQESADSYVAADEPEDDPYGENEIWEHDEEMDEEIQAAYQQFLNMGKHSSTNR